MNIVQFGNYSKLVATRRYEADDIIRVLTGPIVDSPTRTSIQISSDRHVEDSYGQYINHSFEPTARIVNGCVVAIRIINSGDEITFNYNENETHMACPFIDSVTGKNVSGSLKIN